LTCKNRLPYNLYYVGGDVKHFSSLTHSDLKKNLGMFGLWKAREELSEILGPASYLLVVDCQVLSVTIHPDVDESSSSSLSYSTQTPTGTFASHTSRYQSAEGHRLSTLWRLLLPHGYSYKASCARPSFAIFDIRALWRSAL